MGLQWRPFCIAGVRVTNCSTHTHSHTHVVRIPLPLVPATLCLPAAASSSDADLQEEEDRFLIQHTRCQQLGGRHIHFLRRVLLFFMDFFLGRAYIFRFSPLWVGEAGVVRHSAS